MRECGSTSSTTFNSMTGATGAVDLCAGNWPGIVKSLHFFSISAFMHKQRKTINDILLKRDK